MHVLQVVGVRPQFIKVAEVSHALAAHGGFRETVVHTGQHFDPAMSRVFFDEFQIPAPRFNLEIHSLAHGAMTGRTLEALEALMITEAPDLVMIYGDTNATLAGALAAAELKIPLGHVEAGMRSFIRHGPEEINRVVADHTSDHLYAVTPTAVANLIREGIAPDRIDRVGDVMYDSALRFATRAPIGASIVETLGLTDNGYVLCTAHRAENTDDPAKTRRLIDELTVIARTIPVILPLHPRTRKFLQGLYGEVPTVPGLRLIEPIGYADMVQLSAARP